jgi:hypothetical protein
VHLRASSQCFIHRGMGRSHAHNTEYARTSATPAQAG